MDSIRCKTCYVNMGIRSPLTDKTNDQATSFTEMKGSSHRETNTSENETQRNGTNEVKNKTLQQHIQTNEGGTNTEASTKKKTKADKINIQAKPDEENSDVNKTVAKCNNRTSAKQKLIATSKSIFKRRGTKIKSSTRKVVKSKIVSKNKESQTLEIESTKESSPIRKSNRKKMQNQSATSDLFTKVLENQSTTSDLDTKILDNKFPHLVPEDDFNQHPPYLETPKLSRHGRPIKSTTPHDQIQNLGTLKQVRQVKGRTSKTPLEISKQPLLLTESSALKKSRQIKKGKTDAVTKVVDQNSQSRLFQNRRKDINKSKLDVADIGQTHATPKNIAKNQIKTQKFVSPTKQCQKNKAIFDKNNSNITDNQNVASKVSIPCKKQNDISSAKQILPIRTNHGTQRRKIKTDVGNDSQFVSSPNQGTNRKETKANIDNKFTMKDNQENIASPVLVTQKQIPYEQITETVPVKQMTSEKSPSRQSKNKKNDDHNAEINDSQKNNNAFSVSVITENNSNLVENKSTKIFKNSNVKLGVSSKNQRSFVDRSKSNPNKSFFAATTKLLKPNSTKTGLVFQKRNVSQIKSPKSSRNESFEKKENLAPNSLAVYDFEYDPQAEPKPRQKRRKPVKKHSNDSSGDEDNSMKVIVKKLRILHEKKLKEKNEKNVQHEYKLLGSEQNGNGEEILSESPALNIQGNLNLNLQSSQSLRIEENPDIRRQNVKSQGTSDLQFQNSSDLKLQDSLNLNSEVPPEDLQKQAYDGSIQTEQNFINTIINDFETDTEAPASSENLPKSNFSNPNQIKILSDFVIRKALTPSNSTESHPWRVDTHYFPQTPANFRVKNTSFTPAYDSIGEVSHSKPLARRTECKDITLRKTQIESNNNNIQTSILDFVESSKPQPIQEVEEVRPGLFSDGSSKVSRRKTSIQSSKLHRDKKGNLDLSRTSSGISSKILENKGSVYNFPMQEKIRYGFFHNSSYKIPKKKNFVQSSNSYLNEEKISLDSFSSTSSNVTEEKAFEQTSKLSALQNEVFHNSTINDSSKVPENSSFSSSKSIVFQDDTSDFDNDEALVLQDEDLVNDISSQVSDSYVFIQSSSPQKAIISSKLSFESLTKVSPRLFQDISSKIVNTNSYKESTPLKTNKLLREQNLLDLSKINPHDTSDENLFGFSSIAEENSFGRITMRRSPNKQKEAKVEKENLPTRLSMTAIKKTFSKHEQAPRIIEQVTTPEKERNSPEELSPQDVPKYKPVLSPFKYVENIADVSVPLFEEPLPVIKETSRQYKNKKTKKRILSDEDEDYHDEVVHVKKKHKDAKTAEEEKEANELASHYNSMFEEIDKVSLCIE